MPSEKTVTPRHRQGQHEDATDYREMGEVLQKTSREFGTRSFMPIEGTFDAPGQSLVKPGESIVDNRTVSAKQEPRNSKEAVEDDVLYQRFDCSNGLLNGLPCGGKNTVQPQDQTGQYWQCQQCGKEYKLS